MPKELRGDLDPSASILPALPSSWPDSGRGDVGGADQPVTRQRSFDQLYFISHTMTGHGELSEAATSSRNLYLRRLGVADAGSAGHWCLG